MFTEIVHRSRRVVADNAIVHRNALADSFPQVSNLLIDIFNARFRFAFTNAVKAASL